jgi:hypothetical protein
MLAITGVLASLAGLGLFSARAFETSFEWSLSAGSIVAVLTLGVLGEFIVRWLREVHTSTRVFISYTRDQIELAKQISAELREKTRAKVWIADERIQPGERWRETVDKAIRDADIFLAVLPARDAGGIRHELQLAKKLGIRIVPVLTDDARVPKDLADFRAVDMRVPNAEGLAELVRAAE